MDKRFLCFFLALIFLASSSFAATLSVTRGLSFPDDFTWDETAMLEAGEFNNMKVLSQWVIENVSGRTVKIKSLMIQALGTADESLGATSFYIYHDWDNDGLFNYETMDDDHIAGGMWPSDNAQVNLDIDNPKTITLLPNKTATIIILEDASWELHNTGDTFKHHFSTIGGQFADDGTFFAENLNSSTYNSAEATYYTVKDYVLEIQSKNGIADWVIANNNLIRPGNPIRNGEEQEDDFDFTFKTYTGCSPYYTIGGDAGTHNIDDEEPMGQQFDSDEQNFTGVAVKLSGYGNDTLYMFLHEGSTMEHPVIVSKTISVNLTNIPMWYYFELESCEASCGNELLDAGETCDDPFLNEQTCETIESETTFYGGELSCSGCEFDTSECRDMIADLRYYCESLGGIDEMACVELNDMYGTDYLSGTVTFDVACNPDLSDCSTEPEAPLAEEPPEEPPVEPPDEPPVEPPVVGPPEEGPPEESPIDYVPPEEVPPAEDISPEDDPGVEAPLGGEDSDGSVSAGGDSQVDDSIASGGEMVGGDDAMGPGDEGNGSDGSSTPGFDNGLLFLFFIFLIILVVVVANWYNSERKKISSESKPKTN